MDMNMLCRSCFDNDQDFFQSVEARLDALCKEIGAAIPRDAYLEFEERINALFISTEWAAYEKGFFSGARALPCAASGM